MFFSDINSETSCPDFVHAEVAKEDVRNGCPHLVVILDVSYTLSHAIFVHVCLPECEK